MTTEQQNQLFQLFQELKQEMRELRTAISDFAKFAHHGERTLTQQERLIATLFEKLEECKDKQDAQGRELRVEIGQVRDLAKDAVRWWKVVGSAIMTVGTGLLLAYGRRAIGLE